LRTSRKKPSNRWKSGLKARLGRSGVVGGSLFSQEFGLPRQTVDEVLSGYCSRKTEKGSAGRMAGKTSVWSHSRSRRKGWWTQLKGRKEWLLIGSFGGKKWGKKGPSGSKILSSGQRVGVGELEKGRKGPISTSWDTGKKKRTKGYQISSEKKKEIQEMAAGKKTEARRMKEWSAGGHSAKGDSAATDKCKVRTKGLRWTLNWGGRGNGWV